MGVLEHGLGSLSALQPHCGRYEFKDDAKLVVWDALTSSRGALALTIELGNRDASLKWTAQSDGSYSTTRRSSGHQQKLEVRVGSKARLPDNCRAIPRDTQSVLVVSESL